MYLNLWKLMTEKQKKQWILNNKSRFGGKR